MDESGLSKQGHEQHKLITVVVSSMLNSPELWEEHCLFNIHYIGEHFKSLAKTFPVDFQIK